MSQKKDPKWESGPSRIADLEILHDLNKKNSRIAGDLSVDRNSFSQDGDSFTSGIQSRFSNRQSQHTSGIMTYDIQSIGSAGKKIENFQQSQKKVELKDDWEQFTIRFTLFAPENYENKDSEFLRIIGSIPELTKAGTVESGPKKMKRSRRQFRWLYDKYGLELRPWECQIKVRVDRLFEITELIYGYSKKESNRADFIYEREPSRRLIIQPPETYKGELGVQRSSQWREQDKVWIVNGHIEKADGNFLGELFFTKIGDHNLSIGTYIFDQHEVQRLKQAGITAVLNLMSSNNLAQRGIEIQQLQTAYKTRGMKHLKYSINDSREQDLTSNLFIAAQHLNNILNALNSKVYVHCSSGLSRAPSVVLMYLCLFKKVKSWRSVDDTVKYLKMFNQKLQPNVRAVKKCIEQNEAFQKEQQENFYGAQGVQKNSKVQNEGIEDSFYFPNMVIEESNHNPLKNQKNDLSQKMFTKQYTQLSPISEDGQPTLNLNDDSRKNLFTENQDKKNEVEKNKVFLPPDIEFEKILADEHDEELLKKSEQKSIEKVRNYTPNKIEQKPQIDEDEIREKLKKEFEQKLEEQLNEQKIKLEQEANIKLQNQKKETEKQFQQYELRTQLAETKKTEEQKQREKLEKELELVKLKEQQTISQANEQHQRIIKASQDLVQEETQQITKQKDQEISVLKDHFQEQLNKKEQQILELKQQFNQLIDNHKVEIQALVSKQVNENHAMISARKVEEKRLLGQIEEIKMQNKLQIKSIDEQNQIERQALIDKFIKLEQERSSLAESKLKSLQQQHKQEKDQLIKQMDQQQKATKTQSGMIQSDLQNEINKLQQTSWQKEQTMEMEYKTEIQKLELIIENQQNAIQNQANKIDQIKQDKLLFEMQAKIEFQKENNQLEDQYKQKEHENQQLIEEINSLQNLVDLLQNQICQLQQKDEKEEFGHYLVKDQSLEQLLDQEKSPVPNVLNQEQFSYRQRDEDLGCSYDSSFKNSEETNGRKSDLFQQKFCYQVACEQLNEELIAQLIGKEIKEIAKQEIKFVQMERNEKEQKEKKEKEQKEKNEKEFEVALSLYYGQLIDSQVSKFIEFIGEKEIFQAKDKQLTDQALDYFVTQFIQKEVRTQTHQIISQELQDLKKQKEHEILLQMKQKELLKAKDQQLTTQALDSFVTQFIQEEIEIELNDIVNDELDYFQDQFILEQAIASLNNQIIEDFTYNQLQNIISDEIDEQKQLAIAQKRERKGRNTRKQQANQQTEKSSKQMSSHLSSKDISPTDLQIPLQEEITKQPVINDFFRQQILQAEAEIEAIRKMQQLEAEKLKLIELKNQVARNEEVKQVVKEKKDEEISNFNESMPQMDDNTSQKSIKTCQNYKTIAFDDNYQKLKLTAQHSAEDFLQTSIPSQNQNFLEQIEPMPSIFDVQSQQLEEQSNQFKGDYTEEQYHSMAQQFFQIPPIKFRARRGVVLEEIIASTFQTSKSSLPIIYIRGTLYLVGTQKCICEVKNKTVLLRVQGNSQAGPEELSTKQSSNFSRRFTEGSQLQNQRGLHQRLDHYLQENEQKMRIEFCKMMITHHMNLDQVCEQLISDKMFKQKFQSFGTAPSYTEFQGINLYNQFKKDQTPVKGSFNQKRQTLPEPKKQNLSMNINPKVSSIDLVSAIKQKQSGAVKVSQINLDRSTDEQRKSAHRDGSTSLNKLNNQISHSQGREIVQNQIQIGNEQIDFRQINRQGGNRRDLSKSDGIDQNIVQMGYLDALNKNINKGSRQGMTRYAQEESEY